MLNPNLDYDNQKFKKFCTIKALQRIENMDVNILWIIKMKNNYKNKLIK